MEKCENCVMDHGTLFDEDPAVEEAHQLAITLRCAGVSFKLQSNEISTEGHKLRRKLNSFSLHPQ